MRTAIDSSILFTILNQEPEAEKWSEALHLASEEGDLLISPIAFAEYSAAFDKIQTPRMHLAKLSIAYDFLSEESAYLAGQIFKSYRRAGGPREHLIPDFLIAAHAQTQADRLAAIDRGFLRRYFPDLTLLPAQV